MKILEVQGARGVIARNLRSRIFSVASTSVTFPLRFEIKAPILTLLEDRTAIPVTGILFERSGGR